MLMQTVSEYIIPGFMFGYMFAIFCLLKL